MRGELLDDRFQVIGRIGQGGMAEIFLAKSVGAGGFERLVVIKRLLPHLRNQPEFRAMFLDEARTVASIRHPNVVQVHELVDVGTDHLLVMEYLEGEACSLLRRIGPMEPSLAAFIGSEAAAGLAAAHRLKTPDGKDQKLIHRDVTPQNIFVTYSGEVKVLDFGVARTEHRYVKTQTGAVKGKLAYMAPEQLHREPMDHRVDLFALGAVLWELLTGRKLFDRGSEGATVMAVCKDEVPSPRVHNLECSEELAAVVLRMLERDPQDRYADADEAAAALRNANARARDARSELVALLEDNFAERKRKKGEFAIVTSPSGTGGRSYQDQLDAALAGVHRTPPTGETLDGVRRSSPPDKALSGASDSPQRRTRRAQLGLVVLMAGAAVAIALWLNLGDSSEVHAVPLDPIATEPSTPAAAVPVGSEGGDEGVETEAEAVTMVSETETAETETPEAETPENAMQESEAPEAVASTGRRRGRGMRGTRMTRMTRMTMAGAESVMETATMSTDTMEASMMSSYFAFD